MYIIKAYPSLHKWEANGSIVMCWSKELENGNYDFDDIIHIFQLHKKELGIRCSDADISEIVNVEGIEAMNAYMDFGRVEFFGMNKWLRDDDAESLWHEFGDVPMDPETECIEQDWHGFKAGTHREDIWHWFEEAYSVSVARLMGVD